MLLSWTVLLCLLGALVWTVLTRSAAAAWLLLATSALWLPANGHLEGETLLVLGTGQGVTASDLLGLVGGGVATLALVTRAHRSAAPDGRARVRASAMLAACGAVLALGALAAVAA